MAQIPSLLEEAVKRLAEKEKGWKERFLPKLGAPQPDSAGRAQHMQPAAGMSGGDLAEPAYKARTYLVQAHALHIAELGEQHPSVAVALNNLGEVQMGRGQLAEAHRTYTRAHAIFVAGLGEQHPNVGIVLNNLGDVLQRQGQPVAAEELYLRALAIFTASFGEQAPPLAYPLTGLGEALLAQSRGAEALTRLEQALRLRDVGSPVELARTRFALARALWTRTEPADRDRARGLAGLARDDLRAAGKTSAHELRELLLWLAAHP